MHKSSGVMRSRNLTVAIALITVTAGCAQVKDWLQGDPADDAAPIAVSNNAPHSYIKDMYDLARGGPASQAEIYADASAAATLTPNPASRLRFALMLATPGHAGSDPERAQSMLRELLSQRALLTPLEQSLATIHLREVEERLVLGVEARRLRSKYSRAEQSEEAAAAERIAAVEAENRQLKESLAEAEEKLEAITSIEKSIREQTDNTIDQP